MKTCTFLFISLTSVLLFVCLNVNGQPIERIMNKYKFGLEEMKIGFVSGSSGDHHYLTFSPRQGGNVSFINENGAFIVSEPTVCRIGDIVSQYPSKLYVMGATYSPELMWSIQLDTTNVNARMAGPIDNEVSMNIIRQLKLYPDDNGEVQINGGEIVRAMPTSIGRISYDDTEYDTFNGSQMFYRYLGAINYLDEELKAEKARNDELEERLDEMEAMLEQLLDQKPNPMPDAEDKKSQILKVYPNPTNSDIYIEMKFQKTDKNAALRIIDLQGNVVLTKSLNGMEHTIHLNLSQLNVANSQYVCVLTANGEVTGTQSFSFVK